MYYDVLDLRDGGANYGRIIIARNIGIIWKEAYSFREPVGMRKFHLVAYTLKPL